MHSGDVACAVVNSQLVFGQGLIHIRVHSGIYSVMKLFVRVGKEYRLSEDVKGIASEALCAGCFWFETSAKPKLYHICTPGAVAHMLRDV